MDRLRVLLPWISLGLEYFENKEIVFRTTPLCRHKERNTHKFPPDSFPEPLFPLVMRTKKALLSLRPWGIPVSGRRQSGEDAPIGMIELTKHDKTVLGSIFGALGRHIVF